MNRKYIGPSMAAADDQAMRTQCPECKTMLVYEAPYCEACGFQFWTPPGSRRESRLKYFLASVAAGLGVAIVQYLAFG
jgi:hypothetical protein